MFIGSLLSQRKHGTLEQKHQSKNTFVKAFFLFYCTCRKPIFNKHYYEKALTLFNLKIKICIANSNTPPTRYQLHSKINNQQK